MGTPLVSGADEPVHRLIGTTALLGAWDGRLKRTAGHSAPYGRRGARRLHCDEVARRPEAQAGAVLASRTRSLSALRWSSTSRADRALAAQGLPPSSPQQAGKAIEIVHPEVTFAPFDRTHIRAVQARAVREFLLRDTEGNASPADALAAEKIESGREATPQGWWCLNVE